MNRHLPSNAPKKGQKLVKPKCPSPYGSHKEMINNELTAALSEEEKAEYVICEDDYGTYKTLKKRLDTGISDPSRNASSRIKERKKEKE